MALQGLQALHLLRQLGGMEPNLVMSSINPCTIQTKKKSCSEIAYLVKNVDYSGCHMENPTSIL